MRAMLIKTDKSGITTKTFENDGYRDAVALAKESMYAEINEIRSQGGVMIENSGMSARCLMGAENMFWKIETIGSESSGALEIRLENGIMRAVLSTDSNYPGIDVEFIADDEPDAVLSRPRVLMEKPADGKLRVLVWSDKDNEDYTNEIIF